MNTAKTVFFMTLISAILMGVGYVVGLSLGGPGAGIQWMAGALVLSLAINFVSFWFSDKIVLAMYHAKEVSEKEAPELYQIVRELTGKMGMPMPKVYIVPNDSANAFATGRGPSHAAVAVTSGILDLLNWEELRGVLAHELAHVKNRDILTGSIVAAIASAIMFLSMILRFGAMFAGGSRNNRGGNVLGLLVVGIVAPFAAALVQMAISRSREYEADAGGAKLSGDPMALANALRKLSGYTKIRPMADVSPATAHMFIVNPFSAKGITTLFSTHPPTEDRIDRLQKMAR